MQFMLNSNIYNNFYLYNIDLLMNIQHNNNKKKSELFKRLLIN